MEGLEQQRLLGCHEKARQGQLTGEGSLSEGEMAGQFKRPNSAGSLRKKPGAPSKLVPGKMQGGEASSLPRQASPLGNKHQSGQRKAQM